MNPYKLYSKAPLWLQHELIGWKASKKESQRLDRSTCLEQYRQLLKSQYWTPEQIRQYQDQQLRVLIAEAIARVPYYQELSRTTGIQAGDIRGVQDLHKFPVLEKSSLRGRELQFVNQGIDPRKLIRGTTSGTTGTPLKLFYTRSTFSRRWAFELRLRHWAGLREVWHPRRAVFTGKDFIPQNTPHSVYWRYARALKSLMCSAYHISLTSAPEYARALQEFRPEFIDGFPSAISSLARICLHQGLQLPRVQAIRVSAETLLEEDRLCIEEAFRAPVFNQYGSSESSSFCSDNPQREMLIHPEFGYVEVLPDGEILTTSFMNPAMPLIRYRIGDQVRLSREKPSTREGRHFQRLDTVLGRAEDVLDIRGKKMTRITGIWQDIPGIIESQIVRVGPGAICLNLVVASGFSKACSERLVRERFRQKTGEELDLEFRYLEQIPRGKNGKFKAVMDALSDHSHSGMQKSV